MLTWNGVFFDEFNVDIKNIEQLSNRYRTVINLMNSANCKSSFVTIVNEKRMEKLLYQNAKVKKIN